MTTEGDFMTSEGPTMTSEGGIVTLDCGSVTTEGGSMTSEDGILISEGGTTFFGPSLCIPRVHYGQGVTMRMLEMISRPLPRLIIIFHSASRFSFG